MMAQGGREGRMEGRRDTERQAGPQDFLASQCSQLVSSGFRESPCLKTEGRKGWRDGLVVKITQRTQV